MSPLPPPHTVVTEKEKEREIVTEKEKKKMKKMYFMYSRKFFFQNIVHI